ncbi:MAG: YheC/YheD family protein [Anaerobacillus sp.]|uniref:YheC/YheD family protein n=1 Tax=Anaerobacillus sp. TaxID=1872506 RepID=UPI00391DA488
MSTRKYAGIAISRGLYKKMPRLKGKQKRFISYYEEAARKSGLTLCYFCPDSLDFKNRTINAYIKDETGYRKHTVDIPQVIFRRCSYRKKFTSLLRSDIKVYNIKGSNYGKYNDYIFLKKNKEIQAHLPETYKASAITIKKMMAKHSELMIKPNSGAIGAGIMKMEKANGIWTLYYKGKRNEGEEWKTVQFRTKLPTVLTRKIMKKVFIVQERINLAEVDSSPFDLRVAVQKNGKGEWQVSGIIAKLAKKNHFLTNTHQGGSTYPLEELLKKHPTLSASKIKKEITKLTLKIAEFYEASYPHMADLGMDIGISEKGLPYFIELNQCSDYPALTFRNKKLVSDEWKAVFTTPIDYAAFLLNKKSSLFNKPFILPSLAQPQQYIGIVYPKRRWNSISSPRERFRKQLEYIESAANKNHLIPCFVTLDQVQPEKKEINAYIKGEVGYQIKKVPCPKVFYNRIVDGVKKRKHIAKLLNDGKIIVNVRNYDYGKYPIWKLLSLNQNLAKNLPDTRRASRRSILQMMKYHKELILKPNIGAVGRGIMFLKKAGERWCITYKTSMNEWEKVYFEGALPRILSQRIKKYSYIVQERIQLAEFNNNAFDVRVAVQRNSTGAWETTAFIAKVAEKGKVVTNVGQGGTVYDLDTILKSLPGLSAKKVYADINDFCINIAEYLSTKLPHIGDLGIDIGLTSDGTPYFIEVNYISDYETLTFRDEKLVTSKWEKVYTTPIDYIAYLQREIKSV